MTQQRVVNCHGGIPPPGWPAYCQARAGEGASYILCCRGKQATRTVRLEGTIKLQASDLNMVFSKTVYNSCMGQFHSAVLGWLRGLRDRPPMCHPKEPLPHKSCHWPGPDPGARM